MPKAVPKSHISASTFTISIQVAKAAAQKAVTTDDLTNSILATLLTDQPHFPRLGTIPAVRVKALDTGVGKGLIATPNDV